MWQSVGNVSSLGFQQDHPILVVTYMGQWWLLALLDVRQHGSLVLPRHCHPLLTLCFVMGKRFGVPVVQHGALTIHRVLVQAVLLMTQNVHVIIASSSR